MTHTISAKQLAANRLNSLKSCGPRSAAGKRQSALNSLKHGRFSRFAVRPAEEDAAAIDARVAALTHSFQPAGEAETSLVHAIAEADWRLEQIAIMETRAIHNELDRLPESAAGEEPLTRLLLAFESLTSRTSLLDCLSREESRTVRQRGSSQDALIRLQKKRAIAGLPVAC